MSIVALVNGILSLLQSLVAWGQARKLFNEHESIIAATILTKALEDIKIARQVEIELSHKFDANPSDVSSNDGFRRD